ncbi:MAG: energy-coupling factor transporter transmembrane protein EcfT [Clostridiales bacterium]|nr:energy-coupling factor transporter transmembrane protein EcfT [Clostridiales bacterium]
MIYFELFNPITVFLFFVFTIVSGIFTMNPVISIISFLSSLLYWMLLPCKKNKSIHIFSFLMVIACTVLNPVLGHNGMTALVVINNHVVSAESLWYGAFLGIMLSSATYWFASYSALMTSDKIIYVVNAFSKKAALVLTMAMRFIPMYVKKARQINLSQKALGLYKDETIVSRVRGTLRVMSALLTYMIEKTIITSDSMEARGYFSGKRRTFSVYSFGKKDIVYIVTVVLLSLCTFYVSFKGALVYNFYPSMDSVSHSLLSLFGYFSFGLLCLSPSVTQGSYRLKWRYLKSKISHSDIRIPARY